MSTKLKAQFAYYLQLQDRVDEAVTVFDTINPKDTEVCQMTYDYMKTYFIFLKAENFQDSEQFKKARVIVQKYEDCPIVHYQILFKKLLEQLDEID